MQVHSRHSRSRLKDKGYLGDTDEERPASDDMNTKVEEPGRDAMDTEDVKSQEGIPWTQKKGCHTHS